MTASEETLSAEELARRFVDAVNRRDADAMIALTHPDVEFLPALIVGARAVYRGHDDLRRWVGDLRAGGHEVRARVRGVRPLAPDRFVVLTEVVVDDEAISPSAIVAVTRDGLIAQARTYLSDERTLIRVGVLPPRDAA